ncbi:glycerol-3-phosphate dehydrogenase/oxidase [Mesobacillus maritimus]|uniref:glycerol-3-phosphate dehydrogenase/oxidase n=1 Tax=Mesobacillus maritimus TaxID=1643336 RepID=UPI00384F4F62
MMFSNLRRTEITEQMSTQEFDLLIIGGGITGAGIALDAASRGLKTALVEMQDFAAGTSSRSTKLVHGGLRYLKQFDIAVVKEVGKEREIVYENGPHVTTPEWMLLPLYKGGTFGKVTTSIGLRVYDFLAGVKHEERRKMLNVQETLAKESLLKKDGLKGGGYYVEYRTDDARLTIEVLKTAVEKGAVAMNYSKVTTLIYKNRKIAGAEISDLVTGETYCIKAKKVVNATGPWVDEVREMDASKQGKSLILSKGVHLVIDQSRFPLNQAIYFDTADGRMVFAIPRNGKAYVGTTDTFYQGDLVNPEITEADRNYLIEAIRYIFPEANVTVEDVESSWAGIRPLIHEDGKGPSEISRKDEIWESDSGLITIAGGKLTGYRKMAETVVDLVASLIREEEERIFKSCQTRNLPIAGGDVGGSREFSAYIERNSIEGISAGLSEPEAKKLILMYGANAHNIFNLVKQNRTEAEEYQLPLLLYGQLIYSIEAEMAYTPLDFFFRRTGALLFDLNVVLSTKENVISYMAMRLSWTEHQQENYTKELETAIVRATKTAD